MKQRVDLGLRQRELLGAAVVETRESGGSVYDWRPIAERFTQRLANRPGSPRRRLGVRAFTILFIVPAFERVE